MRNTIVCHMSEILTQLYLLSKMNASISKIYTQTSLVLKLTLKNYEIILRYEIKNIWKLGYF